VNTAETITLFWSPRDGARDNAAGVDKAAADASACEQPSGSLPPTEELVVP